MPKKKEKRKEERKSAKRKEKKRSYHWVLFVAPFAVFVGEEFIAQFVVFVF